MSILDVNLKDKIDVKTLPDDEEVQLIIKQADVNPKKDDPSRFNLALIFDVAGDPSVDDIRVWLAVPNEALQSADPKRHAKACDRLQTFADCLELDLRGPFDTDDMISQEGWCVLGEGENDLTGEPQNYIKRYIVRK